MKIKLLTLVLIVLVLAFVFGWFGFKGITTASIFESSSTTTTEKTTETYYNTETNTIETQTDLCDFFQPIVIKGDLYAQCGLLGGTFTCQDDYVGCSGATGLDCSGAGYYLVSYECNNLGATYYCDTHTAYCGY